MKNEFKKVDDKGNSIPNIEEARSDFFDIYDKELKDEFIKVRAGKQLKKDFKKSCKNPSKEIRDFMKLIIRVKNKL